MLVRGHVALLIHAWSLEYESDVNELKTRRLSQWRDVKLAVAEAFLQSALTSSLVYQLACIFNYSSAARKTAFDFVALYDSIRQTWRGGISLVWVD